MWPPALECPNGIVSYVQRMREALQGCGIRVTLLALKATGPLEEGVYAIQLPARPRHLLSRVLAAARYRFLETRTLASEIGYAVGHLIDRVHARDPIDVVEMEETRGCASFASAVTDVPVVLRLHGPWFLTGLKPGDRSARGKYERQAIMSAPGVIALTRAMLESLRREYGQTFESASVIPNPIEPVADDQLWDVNETDPETMLFVGRFDSVKGGDVAIDVLGRVLQQRPGARLWFVGPDRGIPDSTGRTRSVEEYAAERLGDCVDRLTVTGPLDQDAIRELRCRARVTIVPSRYDNFPGAALEAMSFGCPVVATPVGGMTEIIDHEHTGILAPTVSDLADAVVRLFDDPATSASLGAQACGWTRAELDPVKLARRTLDYYEESIRRHEARLTV